MGNDPGKPIAENATSRIVIDIKGPFKEEDAKIFKDKLEALLKEVAAKSGGYNLPPKKP